LVVNKQNVKTDYEYRAINNNGKLDFQDFVGQQRAEEFAKKFGLLIAFSLFCNGTDDFVESVRSGGVKETTKLLAKKFRKKLCEGTQLGRRRSLIQQVATAFGECFHRLSSFSTPSTFGTQNRNI
jgi:hypothetical protein